MFAGERYHCIPDSRPREVAWKENLKQRSLSR
jgi:hypothetical protein